MKGNIKGTRTFGEIKGVKILGSSTAFPEPLTLPNGEKLANVTNEYIFEMLMGKNYLEVLTKIGMSPEHPEKVVGLKNRKWTHLVGTPTNHNEENMVDLGVKAGKKLLEKLNLSTDDIDFTIVSSTTPHKTTTSSACAIADGIGIKSPCIDIKAGCTSGLYALLTAFSYVRSGFDRVLLIASETPSKYANPKIKETVMSVGDGAIAILLEKTDENIGIIAGALGADGELGKLVQTPGLLPPTKEAIDNEMYFYQGDSDALKEVVPPRYIDGMMSALKMANLSTNEIDLYVPHQINKLLTTKVCEKMGIPLEKQFYNMSKYGNLAGASVLVALHDAMEENLIKKDSKVALNVVGGGLTWGAILLGF